jgi:hypothetical protein
MGWGILTSRGQSTSQRNGTCLGSVLGFCYAMMVNRGLWYSMMKVVMWASTGGRLRLRTIRKERTQTLKKWISVLLNVSLLGRRQRQAWSWTRRRAAAGFRAHVIPPSVGNPRELVRGLRKDAGARKDRQKERKESSQLEGITKRSE